MMSKMKYKISSRATILLGRESVSKVDGAIIELIKNTYDADASFCVVYFDVENDKVYILDNGTGMTKDTIENDWMMIGTDNKRKKYLSNKDEIKTGEKGIGRFALDRVGSKCVMYTKHADSDKLVKWATDWESFKQSGKNLDEMEADFEHLDVKISEVTPNEILSDIELVKLKFRNAKNQNQIFLDNYFETGTLLIVEKLRDKWSKRTLDNLLNAMGYLMPPSEQNDYLLFFKKSSDIKMQIVDNELMEDFDYKIRAEFDGNLFQIKLTRNEFDLERIPDEVFDMQRFSKKPYRKIDFENKAIYESIPASQILPSDDMLLQAIKKIGKFRFEYMFMKMTVQDDSNETFYYKKISKNRKNG